MTITKKINETYTVDATDINLKSAGSVTLLSDVLVFGEDNTPLIQQQTKSSDVAPENITISSQEPFATATGANRKPGDIVLDLGTPTNGGTEYSEVQFKWDGAEKLSIGRVSGSAQITAYPGVPLRITGATSSSAVLECPSGTTYVLGTNINITSAAALGFSGGTITLASSGAVSQTIGTHTGDATNAPAFGIKGSKASATASTAAKKRGGAIWLEAGRAATPGTDAAGPIYVGLGDEVSGVTDIANGVVFGTGPAVGTIGAADYVPYTTEKGAINVRYDRLALNVGLVVSETAANPVYLYSNNLNQYIGVGNTGISMVIGGATVFNAATIGSVAITAPGAASMTSTGSTVNLSSSTKAVINTGSLSLEIRNYYLGGLQIAFFTPNPTTPVSAAATALGTLTVEANTSGCFTGTLTIRNGKGNFKVFDVSFRYHADTTVAIADWLVVQKGTTEGTISTVAADFPAPTPATLGLPFTIANADGYRCALRGQLDVNNG